MGDAVSMIFFTVSDEVHTRTFLQPLASREKFPAIRENVLLQSRLYPTDLEDQKPCVGASSNRAIAVCLDKTRPMVDQGVEETRTLLRMRRTATTI